MAECTGNDNLRQHQEDDNATILYDEPDAESQRQADEDLAIASADIVDQLEENDKSNICAAHNIVGANNSMEPTPFESHPTVLDELFCQ